MTQSPCRLGEQIQRWSSERLHGGGSLVSRQRAGRAFLSPGVRYASNALDEKCGKPSDKKNRFGLNTEGPERTDFSGGLSSALLIFLVFSSQHDFEWGDMICGPKLGVATMVRYGMVWYGIPRATTFPVASHLMEDKCIWLRRDLLTPWCY